jgi:hypothetical protein
VGRRDLETLKLILKIGRLIKAPANVNILRVP